MSRQLCVLASNAGPKPLALIRLFEIGERLEGVMELCLDDDMQMYYNVLAMLLRVIEEHERTADARLPAEIAAGLWLVLRRVLR